MANQKFTIDTHVTLNWFSVNSLEANPEKFQIIFLDSKFDNANIKLIIENKDVNNQREVKLPGIIIDDRLLFHKHINNLCSIASNYLRVLTRIRKYLYTEKAKPLLGAYVMSALE